MDNVALNNINKSNNSKAESDSDSITPSELNNLTRMLQNFGTPMIRYQPINCIDKKMLFCGLLTFFGILAIGIILGFQVSSWTTVTKVEGDIEGELA